MKCKQCKEELIPCWKSVVEWSQNDIDFQSGGDFFDLLKNNIKSKWLECRNIDCDLHGKKVK